jgi:hypothetical protein
MSQVVCFRLDRQNQREALAVLSAWQEAGYSTRHILTEALLGLDDGSQDELSAVIAELREVVGHAHDLLEEMRDGRHVPPPRAGDGQAAQLSESFIASVRKTARPRARWPLLPHVPTWMERNLHVCGAPSALATGTHIPTWGARYSEAGQC